MYLYFGITILLSQFEVSDPDGPSCPKGHEKPSSGDFCPTCGARLEVSSSYDFTSLNSEFHQTYLEDPDVLYENPEVEGLELHIVGGDYDPGHILLGIELSVKNFGDERSGLQKCSIDYKRLNEVITILAQKFPDQKPRHFLENSH